MGYFVWKTFGQTNVTSAPTPSPCENNALREGKEKARALAMSHLYIAKQAATFYNVDVRLLLAIAIHESRLRADVIGDAGEKGIGQILPTTEKLLRALYLELSLRKVENSVDAYYFIAAHLDMTAKDLRLPKDDIRNILAYNRGASGARRVANPFTDCYANVVWNIFQELKTSIIDRT